MAQRNGVKTQIWVAVSVYMLIAIIKKLLYIDATLYAMLQILRIAIFENSPFLQVVTKTEYTAINLISYNQLNLIDQISGHKWCIVID